MGPLEDRDLADSRRVPVPPLLAARPRDHRLRDHHHRYGEGPGGLVFHRAGRPFDHDLFGRNVWDPARSTMFPRRADTCRSTTPASRSCHACAATTCGTPPARGGCGRVSTPSSASGGRGIGPCRCLSTSTRVWRRGPGGRRRRAPHPSLRRAVEPLVEQLRDHGVGGSPGGAGHARGTPVEGDGPAEELYRDAPVGEVGGRRGRRGRRSRRW